MGFFKKLFEKKDCEICGGEIGLLGNRKLVDGDMCKSCAAKLSPWFEDRRESTVAQIKEQLAYREANAEELKNSFRPTKTLGEYYKMFVMEESGCCQNTGCRCQVPHKIRSGTRSAADCS